MILVSITCYPGGASVFRERSNSNFSAYFFYFYKCFIIPTVSQYLPVLYARPDNRGTDVEEVSIELLAYGNKSFRAKLVLHLVGQR